MPLTSGARLGPYEILSALGAGGMGEVYRAKDTRLDRDVAIKVLPPQMMESPQALERFQREARAASALNHPNICTIFDVGVDPPFIAFELLEGETLQQRLARGPFELAELNDVALAVTGALDAAHAKGIVHRDIKPSNLFLTAHGPKILDFGLAKTARPAAAGAMSMDVTRPAEAVITDPGSTVGTVAYMSPEQLHGRDVDARTDLFSLGLVLYEMATGRPAFVGDTTAVISGAILHEVPVPPRQLRPDLPSELERIVLKLLEKDRDDRYQTAADLRADLRRLKRDASSGQSAVRSVRLQADADVRLKPDPTSGVRSVRLQADGNDHPSSDSQVAIALASRHRGKLLAAAVVVLAVIGFAVFAWRSGRSSSSGAKAPAVAGTAASVVDLQVLQVTRSGNAFLPAISPDGKYVAYVQRNPPNADSLWIRQTTTDSNVQIVAPATARNAAGAEVPAAISGVTVTPDGSFVDFVRGGGYPVAQALWRVPFLGGLPKKVIDDVGSPVSWSPDGRQVAFVREALATSYSVIVADADGSHERVLATRTRPAVFVGFRNGPVGIPPAWSPDGTMLALPGISVEGGQTVTQFVFISVGDGSERVVPGWPQRTAASALGLVWLDGTTLVFDGQADAGGPIQLWRLSYPEGKLSRLTNDLNDYSGISVTADRRSLVAPRTEQRVGIWVGDGNGTTGSDAVASVPYGKRLFEFRVAWAGDRLLYESADGRPAVMSTVPGSGTSVEVVANAIQVAATSDGRTIVYMSTEEPPKRGLWKADGDGQHPVQLTSGDESGPVMLPDDRHVLVRSTRAAGVLSPWIVPLDGGAPTEVVHLAAGGGAFLSPDGKSIMFQTRDEQNRNILFACDLPSCSNQRRAPLANGRLTPDGRGRAIVQQGNIWVQPLDGGAPRQLTHFVDASRAIGNFVWSRDGKRLAIVRATTTSDIVLFKGLKR